MPPLPRYKRGPGVPERDRRRQRQRQRRLHDRLHRRSGGQRRRTDLRRSQRPRRSGRRKRRNDDHDRGPRRRLREPENRRLHAEPDHRAKAIAGETTVSAKAGLVATTKYHFRLVAENEGGTDTKDAANTFTTPEAELPTVTIDPVEGGTFTTAHVSGTVDIDGHPG